MANQRAGRENRSQASHQPNTYRGQQATPAANQQQQHQQHYQRQNFRQQPSRHYSNSKYDQKSDAKRLPTGPKLLHASAKPTASNGNHTRNNLRDSYYEEGYSNYRKRTDYALGQPAVAKRKHVERQPKEEEDAFERLAAAAPSKHPVLKFEFMTLLSSQELPIHNRIQQVGEGTYGKVYKAQNKITGELVALKRLRLESEREGFPITSHREIGLLQSFDHPNIAGLYEMMVEKNQVFMIFQYMNHDLSGILQQSNILLTDGERKNIIKQILMGIEYIHSKRVIHRDIKGSNILIDVNGVLKITDFGLARPMKNIDTILVSPNYTNRVITLWYRPPDILLGSTEYGREADIWGIGCIFIELFTRKAIFQGVNEIDQLWKIYEIMGNINQKDWPQADRLPWFELLRPNFHSDFKFREKFGHILLSEAFNFALDMLKMNPNDRISASDALKHPYFEEQPFETPLNFLKSVQGEWHEFEAKLKRKQKLKEQQQLLQQQQKQSLLQTQTDLPETNEAQQ